MMKCNFSRVFQWGYTRIRSLVWVAAKLLMKNIIFYHQIKFKINSDVPLLFVSYWLKNKFYTKLSRKPVHKKFICSMQPNVTKQPHGFSIQLKMKNVSKKLASIIHGIKNSISMPAKKYLNILKQNERKQKSWLKESETCKHAL